MKQSIVYTLLVALLAFISCTPIAGTNDETVVKSAKVLNPDLTAAPDVNVKVFPVNDTTRIPVYITATDKSGRYTVELDDGMYNIVIGDAHFAAFQDSVSIGAKYSTLRNDTLAATAVLSGKVIMEPNHSPQSTTVQVVGTDKYATNVTADGSFTIAGLAKGEYLLLSVSTVPEYTPTYSHVRMNPPGDDTVKMSIEMIYTGIPVVKNLKLTYDTLLHEVKLSWDTLSYFMLKDFVVSYGQSKTVVPSCSFTHRLNTQSEDSITYYVAVKSKELAVGQVFESVSVQVKQPLSLHLTDSVHLYAGFPCTLHVEIAGYQGSASVMYEWDIGGTGIFVKGSGPDTAIVLPTDKIGDSLHVKVKATADDRLTLYDSVTALCNVQWENAVSPPKIDGYNGTILWNDTLLRFHGNGIWKSGDAEHWEQVTADTPSFLQINYCRPTVFDNKICIVDDAGYLWTSADAATWKKSAAPVCSTYLSVTMVRYVPGLFVYDNKLFLKGIMPKLLFSENLVDWQASQWDITYRITDYTEYDGRTYVSGTTHDLIMPKDDLWFALFENGNATYTNTPYKLDIFFDGWVKIDVENFKNHVLISAGSAIILFNSADPTYKTIVPPVKKEYSTIVFREGIYVFSSDETYRASW